MAKSLAPQLVRDLMTVGVPTCPPDTPIGEISRLLLARHWEAMVVQDERGHAVGVVSRRELVTAYAGGVGREEPAEVIMRPDLPSVPPDIPIGAAAMMMEDMGTRVLFLTHHAGGIEYPAAWLTYTHLLKHLGMQTPEDIKDLGIEAERESPIQTFTRRRDAALRSARETRKDWSEK